MPPSAAFMACVQPTRSPPGSSVVPTLKKFKTVQLIGIGMILVGLAFCSFTHIDGTGAFIKFGALAWLVGWLGASWAERQA